MALLLGKKVSIIVITALFIKFIYFLFATSFITEPIDLGLLKSNDSYWYEKIAVHGHEKITPDQLGKCEDGDIEQSYYAFFPLYPAIVGVTIQFTGLSFNAVAFFYSIIFSLLLFLLFYRYVASITGKERNALLATLFLIVLPFHYYFSMFYTEVLFLLLLIGCFYSIDKRWFIWLAILSSLLVLSRPNGLFMLIPLGLYYLEKMEGFSAKNISVIFHMNFLKLLVFAIPVVVFALYCLYLYYMTGDFFAYKTAMRGWCGEAVWPWKPFFNNHTWMDYLKIGYLILFIVISLVVIPQIPLSWTALIWIGLLLPLVANSITLPRFISVIFVFPILFAEWTSNFKRYQLISLYVILFSLHLWSFSFWVTGSEFSY